jgi:hypothetical protein
VQQATLFINRNGMKTYRVIAAFSQFHKDIVQSKFPACRSIHKKVGLNVIYVDKNTYTYI